MKEVRSGERSLNKTTKNVTHNNIITANNVIINYPNQQTDSQIPMGARQLNTNSHSVTPQESRANPVAYNTDGEGIISQIHEIANDSSFMDTTSNHRRGIKTSKHTDEEIMFFGKKMDNKNQRGLRGKLQEQNIMGSRQQVRKHFQTTTKDPSFNYKNRIRDSKETPYDSYQRAYYEQSNSSKIANTKRRNIKKPQTGYLKGRTNFLEDHRYHDKQTAEITEQFETDDPKEDVQDTNRTEGTPDAQPSCTEQEVQISINTRPDEQRTNVPRDVATAAPATRKAQSHSRGDMFNNSALSSTIDPEDILKQNNPNTLEAGFRVYGKNAGNSRQHSNDINKVRNRMRLSKISDPN